MKKNLLKICAAALLGYILLRQFSGLDAGAVLGFVRNAGWGVTLLLIPALLTSLSDTFGWAACALQKQPGSLVLSLFPLRLGCDALLNSVPAGVVVAESLRPVLMQRRCGGTLQDAIASCLLAKVNMAITQILFVLLVAVLTFSRKPGDVTSAAIILIPLLACLVLLYTGPRLTQIVEGLGRLHWKILQTALDRIRPSLRSVDSYVNGFGDRHRIRLLISFAGFAAGWIFIGLESFVILSLLNVHVSLWQAFSLEAVASLVRIGFFFIPSGLGASEIAYTSLISAFGVPDSITVAATYILLKRSRELLWILVGYSTFFHPRLLQTGLESRVPPPVPPGLKITPGMPTFDPRNTVKPQQLRERTWTSRLLRTP